MSTETKKDIKAIGVITILYFLGHFLLLLSRGFISDSLHLITIINDKNYPLLWVYLDQFRSYALYYITMFLISLGGDMTLLMKLAGFIIWLAGGIALYLILKRVLKINANDSIFIASCFLLFPNLPYLKGDFYLAFSLGSTLFLVATLIYFEAEELASEWKRLLWQSLAMLIFFASFTNNAILVFYFGFLSLHFYRHYSVRKNEEKIKILTSWLKQNILPIILPFAFWILRARLGETYGELGNHYNDIVLFKSGWLSVFLDDAWSFIAYGFFWPIVAPLTILQRRIFASLLLVIMPLIYLLTRGSSNGKEENKKDVGYIYYILWGLLWFALGSFPYIAVHKRPLIFGEITMRYAVLLPLGSSLIIFGIITWLIKYKWQPIFKVGVLALLIVFNIYGYWQIDMDWYRQLAIVDSLKNIENTSLRDASTIVFYQEYTGMIYMDRNVKTSEFNNYLHRALYPSEFKFGFDPDDVEPGQSLQDAIKDNYLRLKNTGVFPQPETYDPLAKIENAAIITKSDHELMTVGEWLKLKKAELFSSDADFHQKLKDELKIEVVPYSPAKILS